MQRSSRVTFLHRVQRAVAHYQMIAPGERVLVAVSGGPDSTALLTALQALSPRLGCEVHAAHLNHRLRGDEAQRDEQYVATLAQRLHVTCVFGAASDLSVGGNLEARARRTRYAFLMRTAAQLGCTRIATGHTQDDQAETVLMRLLRGTGGNGLAGIHPVREGRIIRPLIECARADVLAYLHDCGLEYCDDSSNENRRFLRNRIRHDVMPLLRSINPRVTARLASTAQMMAEESAVLDDRARAVLGDDAHGALPLSVVHGAPQGLRARIVRAWLRAQRGDLLGLSARHVRAVADVAAGPGPNASVRLPGGQVVVREYQRLIWRRRPLQPAVIDLTQLAVPGMVSLSSGWRITSEVVTASRAAAARPLDLCHLMADAARVDAPLLIRGARPGDRIRPLGGRGHRKLQDIFVDRKLPVEMRRSCPVIESGGEILWVPGVVRSDRALVSAATRSTLRLVAEKTGIAGT